MLRESLRSPPEERVRGDRGGERGERRAESGEGRGKRGERRGERREGRGERGEGRGERGEGRGEGKKLEPLFYLPANYPKNISPMQK
jgi:hypothetical protein